MNNSDARAVRRLLDAGALTPEQVAEAEEALRTLTESGRPPRPLTELLVELGHLDADRLEHAQREEHSVQGRDEIAGFRLRELVGQGSLGRVYKAEQVSLGREVAVKVLDSELAGDEQYVRRFLDEARRVARLSHTNLISGIDVGVEDGIPYLAMEYADGVSLGRLLRRGGALDEERALQIALQLARALEYAHKNDMVHGQVRPENVIVTGDGVVKLCDLGQARRQRELESEEDPGMDTADYGSPERLRGLQDVGAAADLYSLGCVLYHMLVGDVPFPAATRQAAALRHLTETAPSVREADSLLGEETANIVARLLQKKPEQRFASATEVAAALEAALRTAKARRAANEPPATAASGTAPAAAGPKPIRRRRRRR